MGESDTERVRLTVTGDESTGGAVVAFRADGELVELGTERPSVVATPETPDD